MTYNLQSAINQLKILPEKVQDQIAQYILDEIAWQSSFDQNPQKLSHLAAEALGEYKAGKTKPMDI